MRNINYKDLINIREEKVKELNLILNEIASRPETYIPYFGLTSLNSDKHLFLTSILSNIDSVVKVNGLVSTYKESIPFYGLEVTLNGKLYTIMYQSDSDYTFTLNGYCEGNKPQISRSSSNIFDIGVCHDMYGMDIDELENELRDYEPIEILTILYCINQM